MYFFTEHSDGQTLCLGDRLGFPVFPLEWHDPKSGEISSGYRESGYLPEAVINFLALLGWNPGNDQEIMSLDELVKLFDLHRCSKAGAKFDYEKARWFNHGSGFIRRKGYQETLERRYSSYNERTYRSASWY